MAIAFIDFCPLVFGKKGIKESKNMQELLGDVNAWLSDTEVEVVNIETILLPGSGSSHDGDVMWAEPPSQFAGHFASPRILRQSVRVWYRAIA